jgi:two-component sensor histidine kinase
MKLKREMTTESFLWHDESELLARLAEQQSRLVSDTLARAASTDQIVREKEQLASDLSGARAALDGSLDRLQEVHHRVRNHLQTLTGLLSAQELPEESPAARRALQNSIARITAVAAIHDLLAREPRSSRLRLPELAQRLAGHLLHQAGAEQRLQVRIAVSPIDLPQREATAFVLILAELLSNAIEHGFPEGEGGEIDLTITCAPGEVALEVRDSGRGLPLGFDLSNADGLGLGLVTRLAERDLGGTASAWNDGGACFRVAFPISTPQPAG